MSIIGSLKKLFENPDIHNLYRLMTYGKVVNPTTLFEMRERNFTGYQRPIFFLSTGRCGTSWFTKLLATNKKLKVFHVPEPELAAQSRLSYQILKERKITEREENLLTEIFLTGREELFLNCIKSDLRFIETDPRPTFLAPLVAKIWPDSIFVHLYRHPAEVVRSGIQRNWYQTHATHELSRIQPLASDKYFKNWETFDQLEKISWLWNETNLFIEDFIKTLPKERYTTFNFNGLTTSAVVDLLEFLQIEIKSNTINKRIDVKVNKQNHRDFPEYSLWDDDMKNKLINICGPLMEKYNYTL